MSIDAVAILRITRLAPPMTPLGVPHPVSHQDDASLVSLMVPFDPDHADEHALALRHLLGDALDAHDDPRGILFVPDVARLDAPGYAELVAAHNEGGVWTPMVGDDHVPARYAAAEPGAHDALTGEMIAALGHDAAQALEMRAELALINQAARPGDVGAEPALREALAAIAARLGPDFAARYEASLRRRVQGAIAGMAPPPIRLD